MTTTTPTADYRAGTDPTLKNWHLTSVERGNQCFCGAVLIFPADTRKVALKVPEDKRTYELSEDLTRVTCGACKRSREYGYATGTATRPEAEVPTVEAPRRGRRRAGTLPAEPHASGIAAAAAEATATENGQPSKRRRKSRADRANEQQQRDAAKAAATAAVDAIDAALADNAAATGTTPAEGDTAE
jgi:hypothetical protein